MTGAPQDLFDAAFAVIHHSYSPYSKFKVACAIRSEDGHIFSGVNVENASYSLAQCAEGSAIGALVSNGQRQVEEVLVLVDDAQVATPCGACRQRLFELATADTVVHLCTVTHDYACYRLSELLPFAFELNN